ncbi:hypothetical protein FPQ18DRAFT_307511 [Pyronema domesticum]|nr:hypothetical protein FPQ18DRAFT_307511 [Pyronema domesticum]
MNNHTHPRISSSCDLKRYVVNRFTDFVTTFLFRPFIPDLHTNIRRLRLSSIRQRPEALSCLEDIEAICGIDTSPQPPPITLRPPSTTPRSEIISSTPAIKIEKGKLFVKISFAKCSVLENHKEGLPPDKFRESPFIRYHVFRKHYQRRRRFRRSVNYLRAKSPDRGFVCCSGRGFGDRQWCVLVSLKNAGGSNIRGLPMHVMLGRPAFVVFDTVDSVEAIAQAHALMEAYGLGKLESVYHLPTTTDGTLEDTNTFGALLQSRFTGGMIAVRGLVNQ